MRFHLASALSGLGVAGLVLLLTSQSSLTVGSVQARVEYMPHPRDCVQIREGTPYTVPAGKIFSLTALGGVAGGGCFSATLKVNGQVEAGSFMNVGCGSATTSAWVATTPLGMTVPAGSTIEPVLSGNGRAWGYLAED